LQPKLDKQPPTLYFMIENQPIRTIKMRALTIKSATFDNQLSLVTIVDHIFKLDDTHVLEDYFLTQTSVCDHTLREACNDDYKPSIVHQDRVYCRDGEKTSSVFHKACRLAYATHEKHQEIYNTLRV